MYIIYIYIGKLICRRWNMHAWHITRASMAMLFLRMLTCMYVFIIILDLLVYIFRSTHPNTGFSFFLFFSFLNVYSYNRKRMQSRRPSYQKISHFYPILDDFVAFLDLVFCNVFFLIRRFTCFLSYNFHL
jgi:hypothetical protein